LSRWIVPVVFALILLGMLISLAVVLLSIAGLTPAA
jgi:hypothetical protein